MQISSYQITTAKIHDINSIKKGLLNGNTGKILADSGYVSRAIFHDLQLKNIYLISKPKNNMMSDNEAGIGYLPEWEINFSKLHSTKALSVHILSVLLANQLLRLNELTFVNL